VLKVDGRIFPILLSLEHFEILLPPLALHPLSIPWQCKDWFMWAGKEPKDQYPPWGGVMAKCVFQVETMRPRKVPTACCHPLEWSAESYLIFWLSFVSWNRKVAVHYKIIRIMGKTNLQNVYLSYIFDSCWTYLPRLLQLHRENTHRWSIVLCISLDQVFR
jgi:hypothetical protein